jgi:hypothetical protein
VRLVAEGLVPSPSAQQEPATFLIPR